MDGRLARARGKLRLDDASAVRRSIEVARAEGSELDLGPAWAALHFLIAAEIPMPKPVALERGLSWSEDSLANVLMGGSETAYRASFGPARYLKAAEVQRFAGRLLGLNADEIIHRYDPAALAEENIPPGPWNDDSPTREWLRGRFVALADFYRTTAASGDGLLLYMV
jgi:hypothetical protein